MASHVRTGRTLAQYAGPAYILGPMTTPPPPPALVALTLFGAFDTPEGLRPSPLAEREDTFPTWGEVIDAIEDLVQVEAPEKNGLYSIGPYVLTVGPNGRKRRSNAAVLAVTCMMLDVDRPGPGGVQGLQARLRELDVPALIYGSPSDTPEARRVRVMAPLSRPLAPEECARTRVAFANALGLRPDCGVMECLDPARIFYCGRVEGTPPRYFWANRGAA